MDTYAPTLKQDLTKRLDALTNLLDEAGLAPSRLGKIVKNDGNWVKDYRDRNIRVDTYDMVVAKISALWPDHIAWPADVPRPAPSAIEPTNAAEVAEIFRAALAKKG